MTELLGKSLKSYSDYILFSQEDREKLKNVIWDIEDDI